MEKFSRTARADLRKTLRDFLASGNPQKLQPAIDTAAKSPGGGRPVLYEAFSQALSGNPMLQAENLRAIPKAIGVSLDYIDRAVMEFCLGDTGSAFRFLDRAPQVGRFQQRAVLWRAFFRGKQALDAGIHTSSEPVELFQFWDKAPPDDVRDAMDEWRELQAGQPYSRYDEISAREVVAAANIPDLLKCYDEARHPAMKSDLFRLAKLMQSGGLYVDADTRPTAETADVIKAASRQLHVTFYVHQPHGLLQNAALLASPGHPLIVKALEYCIKQVMSDQDRRISTVTGPAVLTQAFFDLAKEAPIDCTMMAFSECNTRFARNFPASYKNDERSWHLKTRR